MTKTRSTKISLISSVLALFLCLAMLLGTTFAWFTDSVTSGGNIIQSGTLDIEMYWANGHEAVPTDNSGWKDASKDAIFDYDNWEPGYVDAKHIKVVNTGNLAFRYRLSIIPNGEVSELADVIDVYYIDPATQMETRDMLADATRVGTLADLINAKDDAARGVLLPVGATPNSVEEVVGEKSITLALKMRENAGNEYQGLSIGSDFSIQILATQYAYENDSFGNQYDEDASYTLVTTADELYETVAAASGDAIIAVDGNIKLTKALSKSGLSSIRFVAMDEEATIDQATYNMHFSGAKVTFEGLTLTHGEKAYGNGGQTSTAFAVWDASEVNYIDCTFNRSVGTIHAAIHNFIGCTFNGVENPDNSKSEYPLYICDGEEYNVVDCVFNATNRGAILFYNDGGSGVDTLNISNTKFLGDIIADKTAVEIHNNAAAQVYNVNIKDVIVGDGVINGLYRIKPANVGAVNVNVDNVTYAKEVSTNDELAKTLVKKNNGSTVVLAAGEYTLPNLGNTIDGFTIIGTKNAKVTGMTAKTSGFKNMTFQDITFTGDIKGGFSGNCTIKDCTFDEAGLTPSCNANNGAVLTIENCTFNNSPNYAIHFGGKDGGKVIVKNCTFNGGYVINPTTVDFSMIECDFNDTYFAVYGSITLTDSTFDSACKLYIHSGTKATDVTVTMNGCTVDGGADVADICYDTGNNNAGIKQFIINGTTYNHTDMQPYN